MMMSPDDEISRTFVSSRAAVDGRGDSGSLGHYLLAVDGTDPGRIIEVRAETLTIGRDSRQSLVFADSEISRVHARVSLVRGAVVVEDLGSTNGTFVDGGRIAAPTLLAEGGLLQVGQQVLKYERRDSRDVARSLELRRDLVKASGYVLSLLPAPIENGPVRASWRFLPSAQLGGDAFGYYWLDRETFVFYLMDVSGHGAGAAMHSVGVLNLLRQRALPGVDFTDPVAVLASLNSRFQMETCGGMFFTLWYGAYNANSRTLTYSAAGHHAAYLVPADRAAADPLGISQLVIGAAPEVQYRGRQTAVPPGSTLYLFSDGVFEIVTKEQRQWALSDFVPHLLEPPVLGVHEPERLYRVVRQRVQSGLLDDDFSLLTITFQ
jgi:serine phosphatase RsbU (regulator of sigma subunit)